VIVGLANHTALIRRDGAERAIADSAAPIRNPAGNVYGVVLVFRDVTEAHQAELALGRLAAIVENSDDAIISKDLHGIITSWNKAAERIFGYTAKEAIGKLVTILIPPERQNEEDDILRSLRRGELVDHFQTVRITKEGRRINVSVTISPIRDASGQIIGASKIARVV
jgi:PAS domain S-box-containing protein